MVMVGRVSVMGEGLDDCAEAFVAATVIIMPGTRAILSNLSEDFSKRAKSLPRTLARSHCGELKDRCWCFISRAGLCLTQEMDQAKLFRFLKSFHTNSRQAILFHGDGFCQISWLVHVTPAQDGDVIGK